MKSIKRFFKQPQTGDTIIEVLVSIAVMGIVLAGGYGIANRTLSTGQSADKRTKALATAQSQIEFIINAQNASAGTIDQYKLATDFCIPPDGTTPKDASTDTCQSYNGQPYSVAIKYLNNLFTVTTKWTSSATQTDPDHLTLYYKLPGTYIALSPPPAPLPPPGPGPAPPPEPPPPVGPFDAINPIWRITYETGGIFGDPAEIGATQYDSRGSASSMLQFSNNAREGSRALQYTIHSGEWGGGSPSGESIEWIRPDVLYPTDNGCRNSVCVGYPNYPFNETDCRANPSPSARYRVGCPRGAYGEREGDDYWYRFSILPKAGFNGASGQPGVPGGPGAWFIFLQWHGNDDHSPSMSLDYHAGSLGIGGMAGQLKAWEGPYFDYGGRVTGATGPEVNDVVVGTPSNGLYVPFTFQEERWNDFLFHVRWSSYNKGGWELYHKLASQNNWNLLGSKNGVPTLHRTAPAIGVPQGRNIDNYLKGGMYRQPSPGVSSAGSCYDASGGRQVGNLVFHCGAGATASWIYDAVRQGFTRKSVDETL